MDDRGSLTLPRNGAQRVRASWQEHFAETPDVLKSSEHQQTVVPVLDLEIGGDDFITMAGPCSVETELQLITTAIHVRRGGARILRGGAFKPRSSPYAFQGHGLEGLKMLAALAKRPGLAIVTEVMSEDDVSLVAEYADILQIGSRNMENFTLLEAAARSGRPILLKRGMMATVADMLRSAQVVLDNGNPNVILCERGIRTFETSMRNTFDVAAIALIKEISHLPIIADPSHAAGHRDLVPALARVAVAAGADGLIVEVHPNPDKAWSDGEQSLTFAEFDEMMSSLEPYIALRGAMRRQSPRWRLLDEGLGQSCCALWHARCCCCRSVGSLPIYHKRSAPDVIVTAAPVYDPLAALRGGERFPKGAQLLLVHEGKAEPLVAGFAASADANVSFDAQKVLVRREETCRRSVADLGTDARGSFGAPGDYGFGRRDTAVVSAGVAAGVRAANCAGISTAVGATG